MKQPPTGRKCLLCGTEYARVADNPARRVYSCDDGCGAYEVITKGGPPKPSKIASSGFTTPTWWYHGAQLPEDMAPAWLEICTGAFDAVAA